MKGRIVTTLRLLALIVGVAVIAEASAYDVIKRYKLIEDKFVTHEMLNPFGHDFIFDVGVGLNKNLQDVINDGKDVSKTQGSDADKLAAGQTFLRKYDKTEQNVRVKLNLGIPLPSFTLFDAKIVPDFRVNFGFGLNLAIRTVTYSFAQILDFVGTDVPAEIKTAILSCAEPDPGEDIIQNLLDNNCLTGQGQTEAAQKYLNKYFRPTDTSVPNVYSYAKADARVGILFNYTKGEHWFGYVNVYGLGRADLQAIVTAESLAKDGEIAGLGEEMNTTVNLATDLKFGYKNGRLSSFASIEEIKLSRLSDNEDKGVTLLYGEDPLIRLHSDYLYEFMSFDLRPFVGVHKRSGYGFDEGLYGGGDIGMFVWSDRVGLRFRGMLDKEHFTISPMVKLWLMQFEYMLKTPMKSEIDGAKPSTLHALNFRMFF
jgi:hypothetical protein